MKTIKLPETKYILEYEGKFHVEVMAYVSRSTHKVWIKLGVFDTREEAEAAQ